MKYRVPFIIVLLLGIIVFLYLGCGEVVKPEGQDTTPPAILSTSPANGATNIAINTSINATFSESMEASSINTSSFTLSSATGAVTGTVSYAASSKTATFSPSAYLSSNTSYTAVVSNKVKDLAGNYMSADYTWSFTTSSSADTTRPAVLSTTPTNGAMEISIDTAVSVTFSEEMDPSTINPSTFKITSAGGAVNGTVSYNTSTKTASFSPSTNLSYGTAYTAILTNGMKDLAGNRLSDTEFGYSWSFTTQHNWAKIAQVAPYPSRRHHAVITYNGKMWVIGGYDDGDNYLNDVWSSSDGKTWTEATPEASFSPRVYHAAAIYDNKMWIFGGQAEVGGISGSKNDVWSSTDGKSWTLVTSAANFSIRTDHKVIVYQNEMWLIGGLASGDYKNDVWHSKDGITWTQATASAAFSARAFHEALTYNNKMWVIGGSDGNNLNDVWNSTDGTNWTQATASAAFSKRSDFLALNYNNKMWVMGGFGGLDYNDTWYSTDGVIWSQMITPTNFVPRIYFDGTVFNNKMWVMGGAIGSPDPINEVMAFQ